MEQLEAKFTKFDKKTNWVSGEYGDYRFSAKLFDDPSIFGIKNGRVSKLAIIHNKFNQIVNYERGWDIKPTKEHKPAYKAIMNLLENSPRRFD